jgi:hypothetical protein
MLFLDQYFTLFRMVHFVFLQVLSYVFEENAGWKQAQFSWIVLFIFLCIIFDLQQKQVHHSKEHDILV